MCGIAGLIDRHPVARPLSGTLLPAVARMQAALAHRGPDAAGAVLGSGFQFGFRRLAIIDVAGGHQPLSSEDGRVVTMVNGEIYNFRELVRDLERRGHRFRSRSDAETLTHLFEEDGIDAVRRLRGMFAGAIWDRGSETAYLVRDPFGIKPLYYADTPTGLVFASEIRSLLASGLVSAALDEQALWDYFTFQYVPDPASPFRAIRKVPPGHYLRYRRGQMAVERYWAPWDEPGPVSPRSSGSGRRAVVESLLEVVGASVDRHLQSEVPVGAYLSSGIDSSLVVALMSRRGRVKTFSMGFDGAAEAHDELALARETAARFDTDHHELRVTAADYREALPAIVASQEEPLADPSAPALWFLARLARREVTVVLSGEGADELFGGYPIYHEPLSLRPFERLPWRWRQALAAWAGRWPDTVRGRGLLLRQGTPLSHRFVGNAYLFGEAEKAALMPAIARSAPRPSTDVTAPVYAAVAHLDPVRQMQLVDMSYWLPGDILMKADKMAMAHGLEVRVPYLDQEVYRAAMALPLEARVHRGVTKVALREAARLVLPPAVAQRKKLGFPVPYRQWLSGPLHDLAADVLASAPGGLVKIDVARDLLEHEVPRSPRAARQFWAILMFLLWQRAMVTVDARSAGRCR